MSRGFPASYVAALNSGAWRPVVFAQISYTGGTLYLHDSIGTLTWGGNDWLGVGAFGGISTVEEGGEVSPYALTLSLSGVDLTLAPEVMQGSFAQQPVVVYFGLLSPNGQYLLGESGTATAGAASTITLQVGSSSTDDFYNGRTLRTLAGTGPGQIVTITDYVGSTRVATVSPSWGVQPASGTTYSIDDLPIELWAGKADVADVVRTADSAEIVLTCENELAEWDRASGLLYSEAELKKQFPTDTFYRFMPSKQGAVIVWTETRGSQAGVSASTLIAFPGA